MREGYTIKMSDQLKLKWLLTLICDRCNKAWAIDNKNWCESCLMEQEFVDLGWKDVTNE